MPSSHLILCCPLFLLPPIPPSIRVFSNESTLPMRWPKYWSFSLSISPSKEHPGLISFRMDWLDLLAVQGTLKSLLQHHSSKASILSAFFTVQLSHPYMTTGKTIALTRQAFVGKTMSLLQFSATQRRATHLPHPVRPWLEPPTCSASLAPTRCGLASRCACPRLRTASRRQGAHSPQGPAPAAPPPGPFGFESPAGCVRKWKPLSPAWRARPPVPGARCKSSVPVGSGNAPALPGSCWRQSGATRNSWGWWPRELLPYLEGGRWGQGLEGFCNHLELYTQFAANVERSRTILQEQLKKNKHFRRFVRLQEGRPEFGGLQLQDLLPLPLQRLQQGCPADK
ncbi:rho guanine nucleotide exchange factor 39 isoform X3 [Ovis aries]|uniref:rho guanine nucleotide exchange factor 39 isoform X3 n=1 Tax=Ovis aries TaxID=9940 RepID=UPI0029526793|nr:rho guanine nucleotide exchange factor 39 isoform X3 [Ovis aries]